MPDPAVQIRPIRLLSGEHHFNEVVMDGLFVPDDMVLGEPGDFAWPVVAARPGQRVWTDDYSNIVGALWRK